MTKKRKLVTLREAAVTAGVSISALRKWYRSDLVYSELADGPNGAQRMVDLDMVLARSARIQEDRASSGVIAVPSDVWRSTVEAIRSGATAGSELTALRAEVVAVRNDLVRLTEVVVRVEETLRIALLNGNNNHEVTAGL